MNTAFLLMAEFNTSQIPLNTICEKYLSLAPEKAARRAALQQLPFPAFRGGSQKAPWLVHVQDLAEFIDKQAGKARNDWKKMQSPAA